MGTLNTKYRPEDEPELIKAARLSPEGFAPLYDHYYAPIFRFINKRFRDKDFAADVTQQVFLKALVNIDKYKDQGFPFSSWLYRIAVNEMNMIYRKAKHHVDHEVTEQDVADIGAQMEASVNEEELTLLLGCVVELGGESAQLIEMRFFDKLSFKEIGDVFEITEANAKMKLYRILEKLKVIFEDRRLRP